MSYTVLFTQDTLRDLQELDAWIAEHDSPEKADYVLGKIGEACEQLTVQPERGTFPSELSALGIREYRQIYFKPYRMIYRVLGRKVYIYLVADGRRDMQTLLTRRLLSADT